MEPNVMTVEELQEAIGPDKNGRMLHRKTIHTWIKSGKCPFAEYVPEREDSERGKMLIFRNRYKAYMDAIDITNAADIVKAVLDALVQKGA